MTTDHVGDETALPGLTAGIESPVAWFLADGAYDGMGVCTCLTEAFAEVIIPPPKTALLGLGHQRDAHIKHIAAHGRMAWQAETGYNSRARVEAQIGRQITETKIATKSLNRMTRLGRAVFKRAA